MLGVNLVVRKAERARHLVGIERVQKRQDRTQNEDDGESDGERLHQTTFVLKRISARAPASKQYQPNGRKSLC